MVVNKTKLAKGGEVGEVSNKISIPKRVVIRFNKYSFIKRLFIVFIILFGTLILLTSISLVWSLRINKQITQTISTPKELYVKDILNTDDSDESKAQLVIKYGKDYDVLVARVVNSNPATWTHSQLDEALVALLYADKMDNFTSTSTLLSYIDAAQARGLNVQVNSYGISQQTLDQIRQRTEDYFKQFNNSTEVSQ